MKTIRLCKGRGDEGTSHCVMAATSIVAGEDFSDKPSCVCPTITKALILTNDRCPTDEIRERLLGHLPWLIIGTKGPTEVMVERAQLFAGYAAGSAANADTWAANANAYAACAAACADAAAKAAAWDAADAAGSAAYAAANAANAAYAAGRDAWETSTKRFIDFLEQKIIPVHTTMPVEPGYRLECLVTGEVK
jgi:hypothetical protein